MAMEAQKLRFVRCPRCLQLLVEYSSIPIYQCGSCHAVLRAKNRLAPVMNANSESDQHNNYSNSSNGSPQSSELICLDEQKIAPSPAVQPSENVVEEKVSCTCKDASSSENVNEESIMFAGVSIDSGEHVNEEKCSLVDGNVRNAEVQMEVIHDEGTAANSSPDLIAVENFDTSEHANGAKDSIMDDGNISKEEVATIQRMASEESGANSNDNSSGEAECICEQKCSLSNKNVNCPEISEGSKLDDETEAQSNNVLIQKEEQSQPCEGLQVESHDDLIEELERSLSFSDEEEDFVDIADSNRLNDALHHQIGSCRFSSGAKMNNASRTDPHGQLIEELERSFTDAEEPLDQHAMVSHKDIAERVHGKEELVKDLLSPNNRSANPYEGSIPSLGDGHHKSGQVFQQNELTVDGSKEKEEGHIENNKMASYVGADGRAAAVFSNLSNERLHSTLPSFDKIKGEISYRYRATELRQGLSLDSQDFQSIQKFIESQMDGTSGSLSSDSPSQGDLVGETSNKFKNIDRLERLKKMGVLRDQINRLSSQKWLEKRYRPKGLEHQLQLNSYKHIFEENSRGEPYWSNSFDADSIPSSCTMEPYYDNGRPPRYPPPVAFSPPHSCAHCRFGPRQPPHMPYNCNAWDFNSYYQSSYAGSTVLDHESLDSIYKEQKRGVRKHILRPLSGASPFTICNSCFNLVQMPSDIYLSKTKIGKMQCGQCSKVLVLSFPAIHHADAIINKEVAQQPNMPNGNIVAKIEDAASHSAGYLRGDPVSINEEHGASFTGSFSSQAGLVLDASGSGKKISESSLHRLMGYDSASQLLRHSRVFDDGYESFESMVPISNRVARRKNL